MVMAELLAGFQFENNAGLWSGAILFYMVMVTLSGLFNLKLGQYYTLERRGSSA